MQGAGRVVASCGIVDEFGAAEGHDEFARLGAGRSVVPDALEQRAAEICRGGRCLVQGDPVFGQLGGLHVCEAGALKISLNERLPWILSDLSVTLME